MASTKSGGSARPAEPTEQPAAEPTEPAPAESAEDVEMAAEPAPAEPDAEAPRPFMSEGTRQDLHFHGKATDPVTGNLLELNRDTGKVTITTRDGRVTMADVAPLNPA